MRKALTVLVLLFLIVCFLVSDARQESAANASAAEEYVPGEVVVKLNSTGDLLGIA